MTLAAGGVQASRMTAERSYRARVRRNPFSQLTVRSATHRTRPSPLPCGVPRLPMCGSTPSHRNRARAAPLSYPRSADRSSGSSFGRPGAPFTLGADSRAGNNWVRSLLFAPAARTANGTPRRSTTRAYLVPGFERSTGLGPVPSPPPNARTRTASTATASGSNLPARLSSPNGSAGSRSHTPSRPHPSGRRRAVRPDRPNSAGTPPHRHPVVSTDRMTRTATRYATRGRPPLGPTRGGSGGRWWAIRS